MAGIGIIAAQELRRIFLSSLPYLAAAALQVILGVVFFSNLAIFISQGGGTSVTAEVVQTLYLSTGTLFLFIGPLLTMHSFSEEYRQGTIILLLSSPMPLVAVVLGKFLAISIVFIGLILLYSLMPLSLFYYAPLSPALLGLYMASLVLFCLPVVAIGLYTSSLTERPAVAAAGSLAILLFFWLLELPASITVGNWAGLLNRFSITNVYSDMLSGYLTSTDISYLLLLSMLFLTLTVRRLHNLRSWC